MIHPSRAQFSTTSMQYLAGLAANPSPTDLIPDSLVPISYKIIPIGIPGSGHCHYEIEWKMADGSIVRSPSPSIRG